MFADIVGFTQLASNLDPIELVELLNSFFSCFDRLTEKHSLEKIKTIGDAYMVVGGLPERREDHVVAVAAMALDMQDAVAAFNQKNSRTFSIRIGIHTGPVVAGVIGLKKFIYDLWGDTVNIASRMESHGMAGKIQVSEVTYQQLQHCYTFEPRGTVRVKGKGDMVTYWLVGRKQEKEKCSDTEDAVQNCFQSSNSSERRLIELLNKTLREQETLGEQEQ